MSPSFCVIGGGIMGFSSAYSLAKQFPKCRMTLFYETGYPYTTSNHGFGFVMLRHKDEFDNPRISFWTKQTVEYCDDIYRKSPQLAKEMGLMLVKGYFARDTKQKQSKDPNFGMPSEDTLSNFRQLDKNEIDKLGYDTTGLQHVFKREEIEIGDLEVYEANTWVIDNDSYLPWIKRELERMVDSGHISSLKFVKKRIDGFSEVLDGSYDLVVNCSGLGCQYLVPDAKMVPIRGQYLIVNTNKDINLRVGAGTYICPKPGRVALGSIHQLGRRDTSIDPRDREHVLRRCNVLDPKLKHSEIIKEGVGIRPARYGGARIEVETNRTSKSGVFVPIVHNYGHGSKGIMQHWGCALEVTKLASGVLDFQSKL